MSEPAAAESRRCFVPRTVKAVPKVGGGVFVAALALAFCAV